MVDYLPAPKKPEPETPVTRRLLEQISGYTSKPIVHAGLAPFLTTPDPEPGEITCARMAAEIARAVSSMGCITRDDLLGAGFTIAEIEEHFTEAKRRARVAEMTV